MTKEITTIPLVHLNGSGAKNLLELRFEALNALREAQEKLQQTAPHGRDYYPLPAGSYEAAREKFQGHMIALNAMREDIMQEVEAIQEQEDMRTRR